MDFSGRYAIPASPEAVWNGLNDPVVLKACIPGCEQIEKTSPTDFVATATLKVGPVRATFKGKVSLSELDPPSRCVLTGEGQGGMAGFAKGSAEVRLERTDSGTVLTYTARATVGGKLAQIGQRLIDGAAKQIADDFFKRFAVALAVPVLVPDAEFEADVAQVQPSASRRTAGLPAAAWIAALIVVIVISLLLFGVKL